MGRKKKVVEAIPPCLHCATEFKQNIQWCPQCESHMAASEIKDGVCLRCRAGDNDRYNKRRKGCADRVDKALAKIREEHGEFKQPFTSPAALAYQAWCESPEYKDRFRIVEVVPPPTPEEDHDKWIEDFAGL